eukprot:scaffold253474_cov21-Tisochrysis_lutea.AAC.2
MAEPSNTPPAGHLMSVAGIKTRLFHAAALAGTQPGLLSCALQPMPFQTPLLESKLGLESQAYVKALAKSRGSCEVTGITQAYLSKRLEPMPCWRYDYKNRKIELARLAIVCPQ